MKHNSLIKEDHHTKPKSKPVEIVRRKYHLKSDDHPPLFSPPENEEHISYWMKLMDTKIGKYLKQ